MITKYQALTLTNLYPAVCEHVRQLIATTKGVHLHDLVSAIVSSSALAVLKKRDCM